MPDLFKIARIAAAHGIRGEVKLECFLEDPSDFLRYSPFRSASGDAYELNLTGQAQGKLIARISGIDSRDQAERLRGLELFSSRSQLPPSEPNEYYHHDLIGLPAVLADGTMIGKVIAVENYGAGDIVEIQTAEDSLMLPFRDPFVQSVEQGKITVVLPEYLGEKE